MTITELLELEPYIRFISRPRLEALLSGAKLTAPEIIELQAKAQARRNYEKAIERRCKTTHKLQQDFLQLSKS